MGGALRVEHGLLLPGKVIGDGRYRLVEHVGTDRRDGAQLWRARDGHLDCDVALTILIGDPANARTMRRVRRTLRWAANPDGLAHLGIARVRNVLTVGDGVAREEGVVGMVVADWTRGTGLLDLVARRPVPPAHACRLLEPLAAAVKQAHHHGLVLGLGDPQRVRATRGGGLRLAFPGPPANASLREDVRGLGAILRLLLAGERQVPGVLSDVATRAAAGGIRTSDTILQVLRQVAEEADRTVFIAPVRNEAARKKKLAIGVAALMITSMAVMAWIGATVARVFAADTGSGGGPSVVATAPPTPGTPPNHAAQPIAPAGVELYNVSGDPDSAGTTGRTVDGNPSTSWQTDAYFQQFPSLKPGIGLVASFPQPVNLARVSIDSPSAGTTVEIRTAPSAHPNLADTTVVATTMLPAGTTTVDLHLTAPAQHVLVWITQLARTDQRYQTAINELTFTS